MKKIFSISIVALLFVCSVNIALAGPLNDTVKTDIENRNNIFSGGAGFSNADSTTLGSTMAVIIKAFLSLLGIIFVVLILIAGYKYMTAQGDEGKVEEALESIKRAVIGLIIIVAAYSITAFVFKNLPNSASGGSNGGVTSSGN